MTDYRRIARKIWNELNGPIPKGYEIDHIDQNISNNSISNLRLCTHSENLRNRRKYGKTSKLKGVYFCKRRKKFIAQMRYNGATTYLGQFNTEQEAHEVWLIATRELYGEFHCAT